MVTETSRGTEALGVEHLISQTKRVLRMADGRFPALRWHLSVRARRRRKDLLEHAYGRRSPAVSSVVVPDKAATNEDVAIAARLLAAHGVARDGWMASAAVDREDVWTQITRRQGRFVSILRGGDPHELASYLCNVSRQDGSVGITQGDREFRRIMRERSYRDFLALMTKDKLVSLAEAVGALAVENPAQGAFGKNLYRDAEELVASVEKRIGMPMAPPDIDGGLLKLKSDRGLFHERDLNAVYTAWLLGRVLAAHKQPRLCEIGAGSGRVAYWSHRLGMPSYTIIDLPQMNVVQGYYALRSLSSDRVLLCGERPPEDASGYLQILPPQAIMAERQATYDLVLNQDSFPEMSRETVADYLRWIRASCTRFMSINHESKPLYSKGVRGVSVPEVISVVGGFALEHRSQYWLRRGYVVELYRVTT